MNADAEALAALTRLFKAFPDADIIEGLDFGSAAVEYAANGWEVFPLAPRSKLPALPRAHAKGDRCRGECGRDGHGFHDATSDLLRVARWWEANPSYNIGARVPDGVLVLDVDPRHKGHLNLAELEAATSPLPPTLTCITGREDGGEHLYYRSPGGPMNKTLCEGVDIKTHDTGYVLLPPSVHPDTAQPYRWADVDAPIAGLSRATPARKPRPAPRIQAAPVPTKGAGYGAAALNNEAAAVLAAPPGQRNNQLNRSAFNLGQLVKAGLLDRDEVFDALEYAARLAQLDEHEIEPTINSGLDSGAVHPRDER